MNLVYHTMVGVAVSAVISRSSKELKLQTLCKRCAVAFILNIFLHGIMDLIPHKYSIGLISDGCISLIIIAIALMFTNKKIKLSTLFCIAGAIIPDVIDKFVLKIIFRENSVLFPWHRSEVINIFYNVYFKYIPFEYFEISDIVVTVTTLWVIFLNRKSFIEPMEKREGLLK